MRNFVIACVCVGLVAGWLTFLDYAFRVPSITELEADDE